MPRARYKATEALTLSCLLPGQVKGGPETPAIAWEAKIRRRSLRPGLAGEEDYERAVATWKGFREETDSWRVSGKNGTHSVYCSQQQGLEGVPPGLWPRPRGGRQPVTAIHLTEGLCPIQF